MSKSTANRVQLELEKLAAWLENPQGSTADRSNPYRTAAIIRGIVAAHEAAESRSADLGDVRVSPNQNDKNPAQTELQRIVSHLRSIKRHVPPEFTAAGRSRRSPAHESVIHH
jgi:hypothetical protein